MPEESKSHDRNVIVGDVDRSEGFDGSYEGHGHEAAYVYHCNGRIRNDVLINLFEDLRLEPKCLRSLTRNTTLMRNLCHSQIFWGGGGTGTEYVSNSPQNSSQQAPKSPQHESPNKAGVYQRDLACARCLPPRTCVTGDIRGTSVTGDFRGWGHS